MANIKPYIFIYIKCECSKIILILWMFQSSSIFRKLIYILTSKLQQNNLNIQKKKIILNKYSKENYQKEPIAFESLSFISLCIFLSVDCIFMTNSFHLKFPTRNTSVKWKILGNFSSLEEKRRKWKYIPFRRKIYSRILNFLSNLLY